MKILSDFLFWIISLIIPIGLVVIIISTKDKDTKKIAQIVFIIVAIIWVILAYLNGDKS